MQAVSVCISLYSSCCRLSPKGNEARAALCSIVSSKPVTRPVFLASVLSCNRNPIPLCLFLRLGGKSVSWLWLCERIDVRLRTRKTLLFPFSPLLFLDLWRARRFIFIFPQFMAKGSSAPLYTLQEHQIIRLKMRLSALVLLFSALVALTLAAPANLNTKDKDAVEVKPVEEQQEAEAEVTTVISVDSKEEAVADSTDLPEEDATTLSPTRDGRQIAENEDGSEEADDDAEDEDEDDEDEEDEEEEEEEAARNQVVKSSNKKPPPRHSHNKDSKKTAESKPVPVLGEGGVEDDEAEDLGLNYRGGNENEPSSDEKTSDEKDSDEDAQNDKDEQEDASDESDEERDDPNGPQGLVAEPGSSERGDVDDSPVPPQVQNEVEQQPLAIAVVEREEEPNAPRPVVPVIVEDGGAPIVEQDTAESKPVPSKKNNKPQKKDKDEDDDEDDDEDEDEDEEEEEEAARSEKVKKISRSSNTAEDILYYYPYPANPVMPEHLVEEIY